MQYLGSKNRIAKELGAYLESIREGRPFVEPFCGSCSITSTMNQPRIASDAHLDLILMWKAVQEGWLPPENISEEEYRYLKFQEPSALRGFAGFACSFGGKWFGGYARKKEVYSYARAGRNSLQKIASKLSGVSFLHADYRNIRPIRSLVYCDPPYESTTSYAGTASFNSLEFWNIMRKWSVDNFVLVSSYQAPGDFSVVWEKNAPTTLAGGLNGPRKKQRIEKLFFKK